jgi:hypothetical protein
MLFLFGGRLQDRVFSAGCENNPHSESRDTPAGRIYFAEVAHNIKAYFHNEQNKGTESQNTHYFSNFYPDARGLDMSNLAFVLPNL